MKMPAAEKQCRAVCTGVDQSIWKLLVHRTCPHQCYLSLPNTLIFRLCIFRPSQEQKFISVFEVRVFSRFWSMLSVQFEVGGSLRFSPQPDPEDPTHEKLKIGEKKITAEKSRGWLHFTIFEPIESRRHALLFRKNNERTNEKTNERTNDKSRRPSRQDTQQILPASRI